MEHGGSVVEFLTRDQEDVGSSLIGGTARHFILCLLLV